MEDLFGALLRPAVIDVIEKWRKLDPENELCSYYQNGERVERFVEHTALVTECCLRMLKERIHIFLRLSRRIDPDSSTHDVEKCFMASCLLHDLGKLTYNYRKGDKGLRHEVVSAMASARYLDSILGERLGTVATLSILLHHPPMLKGHLKWVGLDAITRDSCEMIVADKEVRFLPRAENIVKDLLSSFGLSDTGFSLPDHLKGKDCAFVDTLWLRVEEGDLARGIRGIGKKEMRLVLRVAVGGVLSLLIPSDYYAARSLRPKTPSRFWDLVEWEVRRACRP